MTACFALSLSELPVLASDVAVSFDVPPPEPLQKIASRRSLCILPRTNISRKIIKLSEGIVCAFAGRLDEIRSFIEDIEPLIPIIETMDDVDDRFSSAISSYESVECLAWIAKKEAWHLSIQHHNAAIIDTTCFGLGGAIGSGREDVCRLIRKFDSAFAVLPPDSRNPLFLIRGLTAALNGNQLVRDVTRNLSGRKLDNWGSFYETISHLSEGFGWRWSPPSLYVFIEIHKIDDEIKPMLVPAFYGYQGSDQAGYLLIFASIDSDPILAEHRLCDFRTSPKDLPEHDWTKWKPHTVVVTVMGGVGLFHKETIIEVTDARDANHVVFEFDGENVKYGCDSDLYDRAIEKAIRHWQL